VNAAITRPTISEASVPAFDLMPAALVEVEAGAGDVEERVVTTLEGALVKDLDELDVVREDVIGVEDIDTSLLGGTIVVDVFVAVVTTTGEVVDVSVVLSLVLIGVAVVVGAGDAVVVTDVGMEGDDCVVTVREGVAVLVVGAGVVDVVDCVDEDGLAIASWIVNFGLRLPESPKSTMM
jgi:hypothetical protein